jgi:DtxR family transcriptional regulator, Mn-dependent transcriptional regulator
MPSQVAEAYLETIYNMTMEGEPVISARLADKFRVSRPTAGETIKRLVAEGFVTQQANKSIALTESGRSLTEGILRRHRLAERLLFDVLGMDWVSAHEQAHALEHWISDEVELRISNLLGQPATCPHGNPIPGNAPAGQEYLRSQQAMRLADIEEGQTVHVVLISEVVEDESEVLRSISDKGLHPAAELSVVESDPTSAVVFRNEQGIRSVPRELARKIWVSPHGDMAERR